MFLSTRGVPFEMSYHGLAPALQLLRQDNPSSQQVDVMFDIALRQVKNWGESRLNIGYVGPTKKCSLAAKEAEAVYGAMDEAFREAFPLQKNFSRMQSADYVEQVAEALRVDLKLPRRRLPESSRELSVFLAKSTKALEEIGDRYAVAV
jgi:hypothetical protein